MYIAPSQPAAAAQKEGNLRQTNGSMSSDHACVFCSHVLFWLQVIQVDVVFTPTDTPGLAALTALRSLQLQRVRDFDAAALANSAASLTSLQIAHRGQDRLHHLLRMLPQMQQLQQLELPWLGTMGNSRVQLDANDCLVLLSPAKLTCLKLEGVQLTAEAVSNMLAGSRKAPALRAFGLNYRHQLVYDCDYHPPLTPDHLGSSPAHGRSCSIWS
jgi:hypothetical protein